MSDKAAGQVAYEYYKAQSIDGDEHPVWDKLPRYLQEIWEQVARLAHAWFEDNPINDD
jgi:hypothetical protein